MSHPSCSRPFKPDLTKRGEDDASLSEPLQLSALTATLATSRLSPRDFAMWAAMMVPAWEHDPVRLRTSQRSAPLLKLKRSQQNERTEVSSQRAFNYVLTEHTCKLHSCLITLSAMTANSIDWTTLAVCPLSPPSAPEAHGDRGHPRLQTEQHMLDSVPSISWRQSVG